MAVRLSTDVRVPAQVHAPADPFAHLLARPLTVALREFYALLWRAGVVEIVD
jgi:hypothetical protein